MVFGITRIGNPLIFSDNITIKFYGDVNEAQRECSILGIEFNDCLIIGGFFWSAKISKWAVMIGYLLGFRFSTKDEIRTAKKNKEKIIEVWNLLVDKYSEPEKIWDFLENLKEGEDLKSIKTNIEINFSAKKISENKKEQVERAIEKEKREKQAKENDITNNNIRKRFLNGDITLEKSIEEQMSFSESIAQEAEEEKERKKVLKEAELEREIREKILDKNKISDRYLRSKFLNGDSVKINTIIKEQNKLNERNSYKIKNIRIIGSYKFDESQIYVLKNKLDVDLYTISKEHLTDNCNKIKNLGLDVCNAIKNSRVIQGMTKEALLLSMGNPENIDETVYKTKTKSYYFYHSYKTRQKKTRYRFRVDLEDSLVVGWKTGKGLD